MNAVVVQIKPTADAFYPSNYGPWSEYITGTQGKIPVMTHSHLWSMKHIKEI